LNASEDSFFLYKNSVLHFIKRGTGAKTLLVFHGFGQDGSVFGDALYKPNNDYTIYSFSLFFHGRSTWGYGEQPLEKRFWINCMESFLTDHHIDRFAVAGFSLGARFALSLVEGFATRIDQVYLLAPDGIKTSLWYSLATYPILLRKFFKSMVVHPNRFYSLTRTMEKLKLMDRGLIRFAESQMNTEEKRSRVYYSWVVFRKLSTAPKATIRLINEHKIKTIFILGQHDKVISYKGLRNFINRIHQKEIVRVKSGHSNLLPTLINHLANPNSIRNGNQG